MSASNVFDSTTSERDFFVVGIGASAGGLQALEDFFKNMPAHSGAAFVVVQHLSPDFESLMPELLGRRTQLQTHKVSDGMVLKPNAIYLIPPKNNLIVRNRRLHLIEQEDRSRHRVNFPINLFLESLAKDCGNRAVGIVLSGSGGDGTRGIQAIGEAGGMTFVQSPGTAEFDSMPQSAIATGIIDRVLPPQQIAETLYSILADPDSRQEWLETCNTDSLDASELQETLSLLNEFENIDFSHYRPATLKRRIVRRFTLSSHERFQDYLDELRDSPDARSQLRDDLLIGVTQFFRDPPAWDALATEIIPPLIQKLQSGDQLRIWVTACATGEEAYSMAMAVDEILSRSSKRIDLKLFATDIDPIALEKASTGVYAAKSVQTVSPERLQRYFNFHNGEYRIKPQLRENIIFAPHNLVKNAGFSNMHLISCRNVLIYMQPSLQQQVLRVLHFSLASKGVLFLGNAEVLGELESEFEVLQADRKIFRKRRDVRLPLLPRTISPPLRQQIASPSPSPARSSPFHTLLETAFETIVAERSTTCCLIDINRRLLHVFCDEAHLLRIPKGRVEIETMLPENLQLPLNTGLHRAQREGHTVVYTGIPLPQDEDESSIDNVRLKITYVSSVQTQDSFIVVLERETRAEWFSEEQAFETQAEASQRLLELERELQHTRENLQATIEELETTNEEQQATNEELLASNEELQSTNEELHSVNEELYTVNAEYQSKIQELTELNEDVNNLLQSTEIGVIFLDDELRIRKFTPAMRVAIDLIESDIGRPLEHFSYKFAYPNLMVLLREAIATQQEYELEVTLVKTGRSLLLRIHPYIHDDGRSNGLVLSVVDVENLKQARQEIEQQKHELEYLYERLPVGLALVDENLTYVKINAHLAAVHGAPIDAHIGKSVREILPQLADTLEPLYRHALETGEALSNIEVQGVTPADPDNVHTWLSSYKRIQLGQDRWAVSAMAVDITELEVARQQLQDNETRYRFVVDNIRDVVFEVDCQGRLVFVNRRWMVELGYDLDESLGRSLVEFIEAEDRPRYQAQLDQLCAERDDPSHSLIVQAETLRVRLSSGATQTMQLRLRRTNDHNAQPWILGSLVQI